MGARLPAGSEVSDDIVVEDEFPEGFLGRVKGVVVKKWAPQAAILAHPSVSGFLSNSGWSSITESIFFAIPVVALPLKYDQLLNVLWVVEAGVGVEVARDESRGKFDDKGAAAAVKEVIGGEKFRIKARELRKKMGMKEAAASVSGG